MPATSKKQQKFMGIVHAIQKGEQPASKFSKAAQKAAKSMKKKSAEDYASTKHKGLPTKVKKEERDYKAEYKKFQSSTKAKKYRAEFNQYNRKRGTYGNGDGKDASHKGGKIVGFEKESKNRGRAEKSRLKKEAIFEDLNDAQLSSRIKHWAGQHKGTGVGYGHVLGSLAIHLKEMGWDKSFKEIVKVAKELSKKKKVESVFAVKGKEGKDGYRIPENPDFKYDPEKKESVNEGKWSKIMTSVRKGSKAGPWSIVVYDKAKRKVIHNRIVKILQQIPAHYEDVKKKYPRASIGIEDKYGHRVYTESVNEGFTKYHIRLTNTRGWYGVWDKNGKQKFEGDRRYVTRQLKKLKTRMGNVQLKSLIDVATKRKGKNIEFDVVESVDEGLGDNVLKNLKKYKKRAGKNKAAMDAARKRKKKESVGEGTCGYTHTVDGKKLKTPGGTDDDISEAKKMNVKLLQVNAKHFARDVMDFYKELRSPDTEPESIIQQLDYLKDKVKMMRKNAGLKESVNEDTKLDLLKLYNKALKLPAKSPVQMKVRKKIATLRKKIGMDEAKESGIDIARRVVKNKQHEKGLDLTTANFIIQTYKAYNKNPRLQKKLDKMPLLKMVKLAHLVMK